MSGMSFDDVANKMTIRDIILSNPGLKGRDEPPQIASGCFISQWWWIDATVY
ncbi:MAG: hypothetical protein AB1746_15265 [Candidatus Zixiibacteriota bacterium]